MSISNRINALVSFSAYALRFISISALQAREDMYLAPFLDQLAGDGGPHFRRNAVKFQVFFLQK